MQELATVKCTGNNKLGTHVCVCVCVEHTTASVGWTYIKACQPTLACRDPDTHFGAHVTSSRDEYVSADMAGARAFSANSISNFRPCMVLQCTGGPIIDRGVGTNSN